MLDRLSRTMYRRRRLVVVGWIVFLVAVFGIASNAGGAFRTEFDLTGSESHAAFDRLKEAGFADRAGSRHRSCSKPTVGSTRPRCGTR